MLQKLGKLGTDIAGWKMEPFESVFPIDHGIFPIAMLVSGRVSCAGWWVKPGFVQDIGL